MRHQAKLTESSEGEWWITLTAALSFLIITVLCTVS